MYSSYSFLTSALDGVSGQRQAPAVVYPRGKAPSTHWTGGWVGLKASEARGKILCLCRGSNPDRTVVQSIVTIVTGLNFYTTQYTLVILLFMDCKSNLKLGLLIGVPRLESVSMTRSGGTLLPGLKTIIRLSKTSQLHWLNLKYYNKE
jgi:hypothetical protein